MNNMSPLATARDMSNPPNAPTRKQAVAKFFQSGAEETQVSPRPGCRSDAFSYRKTRTPRPPCFFLEREEDTGLYPARANSSDTATRFLAARCPFSMSLCTRLVLSLSTCIKFAHSGSLWFVGFLRDTDSLGDSSIPLLKDLTPLQTRIFL